MPSKHPELETFWIKRGNRELVVILQEPVVDPYDNVAKVQFRRCADGLSMSVTGWIHMLPVETFHERYFWAGKHPKWNKTKKGWVSGHTPKPPDVKTLNAGKIPAYLGHYQRRYNAQT